MPHVVIDALWWAHHDVDPDELARTHRNHAALVTAIAGAPASVERLTIGPPFHTDPKPEPVHFRRGADGRFELE